MTPCSSVSIINFEHVTAGWEWFKTTEGLGLYLQILLNCQVSKEKEIRKEDNGIIFWILNFLKLLQILN